MRQYRYLLWDIDGTLLDFHAAERAAFETLFAKYELGPLTDEMMERYIAINIRYWQALERNELTKPQVLIGRFIEFFTTEGLDVSKAEAYNDDYQLALGDTVVFCDDAYERMKALKESGRYVLAAVTNGTKAAQEKKLRTSGLGEFFDHVFISEDIGIEKPNVALYEKIFHTMGVEDRSEVLAIGDSLTSDIRGGNNAGVDTCWYNPKHQELTGDYRVTYEIADLRELDGILGTGSYC